MTYFKLEKRTKIVATIGPATDSVEMLVNLSSAGMDFARMNMSHGDREEHSKRVANIRKAEKKSGRSIGIIEDLSGPKIRIGDFAKGSIELKEGKEFILTSEKCIGDEKKVYVNYHLLPKEVKKGDFIMLHDGKIKLEVLKTDKIKISCKIISGGEIKSRRGVNVPGSKLSISSITGKDKEDLKFGAEKIRADFVALSFVRSAKDVEDLRKILSKLDYKAGIISKIETAEAMESIDSIIQISDAIMVARGDLAVEIGPENVPMAQKEIIRKCNRLGKPVITATQMLDSMINSSVPTRAEVSDIANSILDGTDAIMLSEETALGKYPLRAVETMSSVARESEKSLKPIFFKQSSGVADSITSAVVETAEKIGAKAIITPTESGFSSRMVSRHRPNLPIFVLSPHESTCRKSTLSFGCLPVKLKSPHSVEETIKTANILAQKYGFASSGDKVVVSAGIPFGKVGSTNLMLVVEIK